MRPSDGSVVNPLTGRREEFAAVVESLLPGSLARLESLALYVMVAVFWGVVLYLALIALG